MERIWISLVIESERLSKIMTGNPYEICHDKPDKDAIFISSRYIS